MSSYLRCPFHLSHFESVAEDTVQGACPYPIASEWPRREKLLLVCAIVNLLKYAEIVVPHKIVSFVVSEAYTVYQIEN
jgi:hypothetical protein